MYRIGIDVGGTFTDFTLLNGQDGQVAFHKVASTPADPSEAIASGIADLLRLHGLRPDEIVHVGHGTTVATNLVIERKGALTGLLTTRGFRDILEIGRQVRPHLYDYAHGKPPPLIAREHRIELDERLDARGAVLKPLDADELEAAVSTLKRAGVRSIAVCFLHAYRNPAHEQGARAAIRRLFPEAYISISSEVLCEFREFERLSTTALNAVVGPRMQTYLDRFLERVRALGIGVEPFTIHSNGGLMSVRAVRSFPVRTCLSGPAAGVVGAAAVGRVAGFQNLVTFDVGGTSTDVSLVVNGEPLFSSLRSIADYPVKTPMIDIHVIGAGGGSIAAIDDAGALKVGPRSAGADPGPAAYGRGGSFATITDAQIVLHRLNPVALLDGRLPVDEARAQAVLREQVAVPLGLDMEAAAEGIIRIANANMGRAIRAVSTERGYDLSQFALFAYGGAGPLHAIDVAAECGIPLVVVPQEPGTMCARGMLLTHISFDFVRSLIAVADATSWRRVGELFGEMHAEAVAWLERERVDPKDRAFRCHIDARYEGQNFEVIVPIQEPARSPGSSTLPSPACGRGDGGEGRDAKRRSRQDPSREPLQASLPDGRDESIARFLQAFAQRHEREYGYELAGKPVEIVNCRLQALGSVPQAPLSGPSVHSGSLDDALCGRRSVYFGAQSGWVDSPVYARSRIAPGMTITGPAVIEEMSSTVAIAPGRRAEVDRIGNLIVHVREGGA